MIKCNQCSYPVIEQMRSCPNCGTPVADKDIELITCPWCGAEADAHEDYCPECGEPLYDDADDVDDAPQPGAAPTAAQEVIPVCTLRPLTAAGEGRAATRTFEDQGDGVALSRHNTMPTDESIDQDLQAHLFFDNGQWFIEDGCEDRRSTFVHAGKGISLSPGDIIRMGDREFEFNIKTK